MSATATTNAAPTNSDEVHIRDLTIGERFDRNVFDENGVLLATSGTVVTEAFLDKMMDRGIRRLTLSIMRKLQTPAKSTGPSASPATPANSKAVSAGDLDKMIDSGSLDSGVKTTKRAPAPRLSLVNLREEVEAGVACYRASLDRYAELSDDMLKGKAPKMSAAVELVDRFMKMLQKDQALGGLVMQMKTDPDEYLYHHGLNVALLSMSIALSLGYDEQSIYHAGIGALFSDIGMLKVPRAIRFAPRALTQAEWLEIEQHPIHTANALEQVRSLHHGSLLTAYQTHERGDGTGYPRRRRGASIHPLARVVAVADTYAAMTAKRPHRRHTVLPYQSMVTILRERTRLDRHATRAILDCMSLFPIGSEVILSDTSRARVLRSNGNAHTRPVVVPIDRDGKDRGDEIDLSKDDSLHVIGVPDPRDPAPAVKNEARQDSAA